MYWVAFHRLNLSRPFAGAGFGAFPLGLPYRDVSDYARDLGLDAEERAVFLEILTQMDAHYLTLKAKSTK